MAMGLCSELFIIGAVSVRISLILTDDHKWIRVQSRL